MPMLMIDLLDATRVLEGQISRKLLEVRPGVYVGSLSRRQMETLWNAVVESCPRAALLVYAARNESGVTMKTLGNHRYKIVDCDGLQLISFQQTERVGRSSGVT